MSMSGSGGSPPNEMEPMALPSQEAFALECTICAESFDEGYDHQPRVLPCGHTYCTRCLGRVMSVRSVKCPVCARIVNIERPDPMQFPLNIAVMDVLKERKRLPGNKEATFQKCDYCTEREAQYVCVDCAPHQLVRFCEDCNRKEHDRPFPPVRKHKRFPINQVPAHMFRVTCSQHPANEATYYSEKRNLYACQECAKDPNWVVTSADYESIEQAARRLRSHAQKLNQWSFDVVQKLTSTHNMLGKIIFELGPSAKIAQEQIQKSFTELTDIIQQRQLQLIQRVAEEYKTRRKNLEEQQEKVNKTMRDFTNCREDLNQLVPKNDLEFLLTFQNIRDRMENLLTDQDRSLQRPVTQSDIPVFIRKEVRDEMRTLGAVGGGAVPIDITPKPMGNRCQVMELNWDMPQSCAEVFRYQVEYEYLPEKVGVGLRNSGSTTEKYTDTHPYIYEGPGTSLAHHIDFLCPGYSYRFRVRSLSAAGWGMWSQPVIGDCKDFPISIGYSGKIHRIRIPETGNYRIVAKGAKGEDGLRRRGGLGAIMSATFNLKAGDVLIVLSGGKSQRQYCNTGGGGGTFVALNEITREGLLIVAGGGGGTRGLDEQDEDGADASLETWGTDGRGREHGKGGVNGGPGQDANQDDFTGPCWGYGGAGALQSSKTAMSFDKSGSGGQCGGFGGGGAVGVYGGGGGGGYSGGGGGRGGGGGGSYVREDGIDVEKRIGSDNNGSVEVSKAALARSLSNHPVSGPAPRSSSIPNNVNNS